MEAQHVRTLGYIAVPASLCEKVLLEGYVVSKRDFVPLSSDPLCAVKAMRRNNPDCHHCIALEVFGLPEDLQQDLSENAIPTKKLDPKYLRTGRVIERGLGDYRGIPCPLCDQDIPSENECRGQVGVWQFIGNAFMASPCLTSECMSKQAERQERIDVGERLQLYHQTDPSSAARIQKSGKMIRGKGGIVGGGIYFAFSARETEWKAEHKGVVLKCEVKIGKQKNLPRDGDMSLTFASLIKEGYDSVLVDRGLCQTGAFKGQHAGFEVIVYSWDQIRVLQTVDRDPVP